MALKDANVYLRLSKSGKGFSVNVNGTYYVGSIEKLNELLDQNDKREFVRLSESIPDGDAPEKKDTDAK